MQALTLRLLAMISLLHLAASASSCFAEDNHDLAIAIVVPSNSELTSMNHIATNELKLIYWKKKQYWQNGVRIHPVNLNSEHQLRLSFSKAVLGSEPTEQSNYWNGLYFHGITPPYTVQSEEAVLRYVAKTKGAVGYVDACKVDDRVSAVLWVINEKVSTIAPEKLNCISSQ